MNPHDHTSVFDEYFSALSNYGDIYKGVPT